jgi:hypothetical protein
MRNRDPRDDRPRRRKEQYRGPSVTLGHIRSHGVRHLLIYCSQGLYCHHSTVVDADRWPDEAVLLDLDRRAVCTKRGIVGADVRPNWKRSTETGESNRHAVAVMNRKEPRHLIEWENAGALVVSGPPG